MHQEHNNKSNSKKEDAKQLVQKLEIPQTPFTAVKFDDKWYLTLGKYRLTEGLETYDRAEEEAYDITWFKIMQIIQIMIDEHTNTHTPKQN